MIHLLAPAKVNFFLEITGKRPDGYHTLSLLFQTISLADELTIEPADELRLSCSDPTLPTDERNLVMRAAQKLQEALKMKKGAAITLKKVVPMGAGLGGGSSDAAAVLKGLQKLWKRRLPPKALGKLAASLGADVPFFLKGGLCSGKGIGDELTPLAPLPKTWMILIYPGFGVSTKDAYGRVRLPVPHEQSIKAITKAFRSKKEEWCDHLFNRFEELVFPAHPELPVLQHQLEEAGVRGVLMSGSGSSVFAVVKNEVEGRFILNFFRGRYPQSWLVHTVK